MLLSMWQEMLHRHERVLRIRLPCCDGLVELIEGLQVSSGMDEMVLPWADGYRASARHGRVFQNRNFVIQRRAKIGVRGRQVAVNDLLPKPTGNAIAQKIDASLLVKRAKYIHGLIHCRHTHLRTSVADRSDGVNLFDFDNSLQRDATFNAAFAELNGFPTTWL